jgi:hypothetical protein
LWILKCCSEINCIVIAIFSPTIFNRKIHSSVQQHILYLGQHKASCYCFHMHQDEEFYFYITFFNKRFLVINNYYNTLPAVKSLQFTNFAKSKDFFFKSLNIFYTNYSFIFITALVHSLPGLRQQRRQTFVVYLAPHNRRRNHLRACLCQNAGENTEHCARTGPDETAVHPWAGGFGVSSHGVQRYIPLCYHV